MVVVDAQSENCLDPVVFTDEYWQQIGKCYSGGDDGSEAWFDVSTFYACFEGNTPFSESIFVNVYKAIYGDYSGDLACSNPGLEEIGVCDDALLRFVSGPNDTLIGQFCVRVHCSTVVWQALVAADVPMMLGSFRRKTHCAIYTENVTDDSRRKNPTIFLNALHTLRMRSPASTSLSPISMSVCGFFQHAQLMSICADETFRPYPITNHGTTSLSSIGPQMAPGQGNGTNSKPKLPPS